ncbi:4'-phosphopantetheinyl transferase family protein [Flavivirga eckloniae]|uniref:4-phosphopantetheinyl transferase n=1 Tax=Flavivirga eckloniae TaxID=1803846 RepID=A0A2K9PT56_9FLAO|nr:4'-phosphopantetheinyl transferase superfamily protein [Flavivirga eckloniae]AUP80253.1 4-phosphopantetheinyl transferase [Flavivirga eckloniae]
MINIFYSYISEKNHKFLMKEVLPDFPIAFQKRIKRYKNWKEAQLSLLGRVLLNYGLKGLNKNLSNQEISYTLYGKPYFDNESIRFNISHSGDIVVCAIAVEDIGIDVEIVKNIDVHSFKYQMTSSEWEQVISSNNVNNSFFTYWTQKESVIKADGMGLSVPLRSFEIINDRANINGQYFFLKEIKLNDNYICYLASKFRIDMLDIKPKLVFVLEKYYGENIFKA